MEIDISGAEDIIVDTVGRNKKAIEAYKSAARSYYVRSDNIERVHRPVYGWQEYQGIKIGRFSGGLRNRCGW